MISALHLLWIVPVSAFIGVWIVALMTASGRADDASFRMNLMQEKRDG